MTLVVIHGWSDESKSFRNLTRELAKRLQRPLHEIHLGDWVSMDDRVTYRDLTTALRRAWGEARMPTDPRSADIVVHSTGALVVRDWMTTDYTPESCPVRRFLMLAPANFGSPLAHKGSAFIGRVVKGWRNGFETGTEVLSGLELGSPYTWSLAHRDLLANDRWYGPGRVLPTVLVGNTGYGGVRAAANEDGGDGTVRISTANLNTEKLTIRFKEDGSQPSYTFDRPPPEARAAFGILDRETHGSIVTKKRTRVRDQEKLDLMRDALQVTDDGWSAWLDRLDRISEELYEGITPRHSSSSHAFQNTAVRVRDDLGHAVDSYFIEFWEDDRDRGWFGEFFHRSVIRTVHAHGRTPSYRSLYLDITQLLGRIDKAGERLRVGLLAEPQFQAGDAVGYEETPPLELGVEEVRAAFGPNRTLLVDVVIPRRIAPRVFALSPAG